VAISEAIRGHQRPSEVIRGHQRPSARPSPERLRGSVTRVAHTYVLLTNSDPIERIGHLRQHASHIACLMREALEEALSKALSKALSTALSTALRGTQPHSRRAK
jgi:hypothetical protein